MSLLLADWLPMSLDGCEAVWSDAAPGAWLFMVVSSVVVLVVLLVLLSFLSAAFASAIAQTMHSAEDAIAINFLMTFLLKKLEARCCLFSAEAATEVPAVS
jgi:hypothetical protein